MDTKIQNKLNQLALKQSKAFCYSCYKVAPTGSCISCGSDDLMRLVDGVGCEYGTEWIIKHILQKELKMVSCSDLYEQQYNAITSFDNGKTYYYKADIEALLA